MEKIIEMEQLDLLNIIEVKEIIKKLNPNEITLLEYIIKCANERINDVGLTPDNLPDEVEVYFSPNLSDHSSDNDTDENEDYDAREPLREPFE